MTVESEVAKLQNSVHARNSLEFMASEFSQLLENQFHGTRWVEHLNGTTKNYADANATTMSNQIKELADSTRRAWS